MPLFTRKPTVFDPEAERAKINAGVAGILNVFEDAANSLDAAADAHEEVAAAAFDRQVEVSNQIAELGQQFDTLVTQEAQILDDANSTRAVASRFRALLEG